MQTCRNSGGTCIVASRDPRSHTIIVFRKYVLSTILHVVKGTWLLINEVLEGYRLLLIIRGLEIVVIDNLLF